MQAPTIDSHRSSGRSAVAASIFAGLTIAVAALGSVATSSGMDWYDSLEKPTFMPPEATFGIVWTVLYVLIALAGWLAWRATSDPRPTVWWAVQMAFNLLWTVVFFGLRSPVGGIVVIVALVIAVALDIHATWRVDSTAATLLFPYFVWCCFAGALTIGVAVLN